MIRMALRWAVAGSVLLLTACTQPPVVAPADPTSDTTCAMDGMLVMDYPGPKGQIRYEDGSVEYFCDTIELISVTLNPEQRRKVLGVFTQDMANTNWDHPQGHWINARQAFYVQGSHQRGSMGPTLATFANAADAQKFQSHYGGSLYRFDQLTPEMARLDGGVLNDHLH